MDVPLRERLAEEAQSPPGSGLMPQAGLPGSQGPSGLRLQHLASPERSNSPLCPLGRFPTHGSGQMARRAGGEEVGGGAETTHRSQPHAFAGHAAPAVFSFRPQTVSGKEEQTHTQRPQPSGCSISKKPKA